MKSLKTVLLGTAAGLLATGVAQAADLPVKKAAAVQYVEVCPVYGAGFYKLPGTDICIRNFGSMKFNFAIQDERSSYSGADREFTVRAGASNTNGWQWTIRPGWDFRSPTEYGTLRTVVQMRVDQRNGVNENDDPAQTGTMRVSNLIHRGYIEWAGFIVGRTASQFPYWDQDDVVTAIGGDPKTTAMQLTYVFNIPGGMKATIGVEDSTPWISGDGVQQLRPNGSGFTLGPQRSYDFIASLSTEQSWGTAKLAAGAHQIVTARQIGNGLAGQNDHEMDYGFGLLAGVTFNLPMLGAKDQLLLQGTWCNGASAYCGVNGGADNNASSFERGGQFLNGLQRDDVDAYQVRNASGGVDFEKTKVWAVAGQLRHYWAPLWRTNVMGSYRNIDVPAVAAAENMRFGGLGDAKVYDVGVNLIWGQSRKTAEIGIEAAYKQLKQDLPGSTVLPANVEKDPSGWVVSAFISRAW